LLIEHKGEISFYPDIELAPDIPAYEQAEDVGLLRCYVARLHGQMVGYAIFFVKYNMHYSHSLQAVQDVLFVTKPHRHGRVGVQLIRYATEQLRAEQVQVEYQHVKATAQIRAALAALMARSDVGALMEKLGYELIDLIYGKRLDR
jgi:GNAT superfamily N-acetyltransferase